MYYIKCIMSKGRIPDSGKFIPVPCKKQGYRTDDVKSTIEYPDFLFHNCTRGPSPPFR